MSIRSRSGFLALLGLVAVASTAQAASVSRFEREYLGIRIGSRGIDVLRKYGSPSKVLLTNSLFVYDFLIVRLPEKDYLTVTIGAANGATGGPPSGPNGPGSGPLGPGVMPGGASSYGGPQSPVSPSGDQSATAQPGRIVIWSYEYPKKGLTNVFALDEDGRVALIGQLGGKPSARTARGVGIGNTYSDVVRVYGFPDAHLTSATGGATTIPMLKVSYDDTHGVHFWFINQRLRGYPNFSGQGPWCVGVVVSRSD